eukprot:Tamp_22630.p1 GENE.Tamp_22630~~Tamp_22630.p1  ORF type:complete len:246 (-),score=68.74 Tamp_22630:341-1078(-)
MWNFPNLHDEPPETNAENARALQGSTALYQDPGRGVSLGKGIAGTLQIKGRASSMLLKGEETLPADVQEEEEKAEKTHRAKARAMYINSAISEAWKRLKEGNIENARQERAKTAAEFDLAQEDREDLNWTEKMLLRKLMDQKQHELDSLDFEIEAAQRRVHLEAGNSAMKMAHRLLARKNFTGAKSARDQAAGEFGKAKEDVASSLPCDLDQYKELLSFDEELAAAEEEAEAEAKAKAEEAESEG